MEKVIIIGAGPAGISAALYAVRGNLDPLVINNGIGALEKAEKIENYYGLEHPLSGQELYDTGIAQAKALGVRILDAQVLGVGGFDTFVVKTTEGEFETQSLILATGSKRAAPKIPGIKEFEGKGVSYCAICDDFFYRGKDVAVLGNGDFAMHEAKELSNTASTVTIYTNGEEPKFTPPLHPDGSTFRQAVWKILLQIPYGQTITYGEIARKMAELKNVSRMSAQAVGGAVGHNEISIIIPCHRVIGTNGSLTGYAGGIDKKLSLLELEHADMSYLFVPKKGTAL